MDRIVVVGASVAGVNAVETLRKNGFGGEITLVGAEPELPYDRPPLSKDALKTGPGAAPAALQSPEWYPEHGITLRLGQPAAGLSAADRQVTLADGSSLRYDGLVVATGSAVRAWGQSARTGPVRTLRTLSDAAALHGELRPGRHVVIIGAGFIGLEIAATARELGLDVSVIEIEAAPLARVLGAETGRWFAELHAANGVSMRCGSRIERMERSGGQTKIELSDGTGLTADVVVAGVGVTPATAWLARSNISIDDGIVCDERLRTTLPGVVAAGDIARWHNPLFGHDMRVEHWLNAVEQGQHAALSLLGSDEPYTHVPYFWSDQFDAKIHSVGITADADTSAVRRLDANGISVVFGRRGLVCGALCVNSPRDIAHYRQAIRNRTPWNDLVPR
ncbi:NAD(P)/FAD-dependent oxidoreductase [Amycolatopsis sp. Poz14]|uniref:NAD(P)/FAD-dependent oxidoreductase n=1 Tax=Amycolatopsis sp. Poz14 TaxID=1447705 RepID=UPI001EE95897|nr:FAD-dependent oxidoreductase [Amycolatopsis sp. Poz14]MCG3751991.1 FAD-dependent oxidoreductase [Amycolatopsis sp. Poz14]